jgi:hypothetical protein
MESQFWEKTNQNQTGIDPLKILGTGSKSSSNEPGNQPTWLRTSPFVGAFALRLYIWDVMNRNDLCKLYLTEFHVNFHMYKKTSLSYIQLV